MRCFVDTGVFVAALAAAGTPEDPEGEESATATSFLNVNHEHLTSLLNLMELRTLLTRGPGPSRERAASIEREIRADVEVVVPTADDHRRADALQEGTDLYPVDSVVVACARGADATLVTFDPDLLDAGGVHPTEV